MVKGDNVDMGWFECIFPSGNLGQLSSSKASFFQSPGISAAERSKVDETVTTATSGSDSGEASNAANIVGGQVSATEGHVRGQAKTVAEALAFLKGEGTVKPDYERVAMTVAVAMAGGYVHGWRQGGAIAASYPRHQRSIVRRRSALVKGVRFTAFAFIYEGSVACLEALRQKRDFVGGAVGGALAGTAFGVPGGMASAGRGLFVGTWLGAVFEAFQIKVAELKSEAMLAEKEMKMVEEENERLLELEKEAGLRTSLRALDVALESWPVINEDTSSQPSEQSQPLDESKHSRKKQWWRWW